MPDKFYRVPKIKHLKSLSIQGQTKNEENGAVYPVEVSPIFNTFILRSRHILPTLLFTPRNPHARPAVFSCITPGLTLYNKKSPGA